MRIVFMGTPDFAVQVLSALVEHDHEVAAVYTRPPAPAGRGMGLKLSPVHRRAEALHLPVMTPRSLRDPEAVATFRAQEADVAVVVAYGLILPKPVLDAPRLGCLNVHASLLPRWRGAAPIHRAVLAGDRESGVAVMRMEEGLDTGPVALMERVAIPPDMTTGELHDRLAPLGAELMIRALAALERGTLVFTPQLEEGVTYAKKIANEEARLDFGRPAASLHDQVRGLSPYPGAFVAVDLGKGVERLKILRSAVGIGGGPPGTILAPLEIACGEGSLKLLEVQRAGRGPMSGEAFLRGAPLGIGDRIG